MIKATETKLKGCFVLEPIIHEDERGYFFESYNHKDFCEAIGQEITFVQDNISLSKKGVLRGLHFQTGEHAQAKLVFVLKGRIQDVVVDLRKDSPTFGQYLSIELNDVNKKQVFVPKGFAHGFLTLSESAQVFYKCDNYYNKESEDGIRYDDGVLDIKWRANSKDFMLSEKDKELPFLN
ncbi:dTDP-4-dehydrorhamnose 3,5-epimerase [Flagellimonas aequoris]|uniref:dTDP-4-dehydrorhamnose 3,5-epimerase n=1 Tax=Flagellimonas aequoris TaxID=2306997 RepID=A0A418NAC1_9FLAO|nr:dTDP-4-dehydrorhamnose 3,5-epimerase [Allomuricauda aequoris]RIV72575.1 dTDP-4-dehydrorhamnose 3,5-epimerase [Allomuricauda aequoris]TXK05075.1 dTDP-4-dehydrorhamnose 3,5-epimerase [Allomuricauda aequoris]